MTVNHGRYQQLDNENKRKWSITNERWPHEKSMQAKQLEGRETGEIHNIIRSYTGKKRAHKGEK